MKKEGMGNNILFRQQLNQALASELTQSGALNEKRVAIVTAVIVTV
jgi:hypothetical protein